MEKYDPKVTEPWTKALEMHHSAYPLTDDVPGVWGVIISDQGNLLPTLDEIVNEVWVPWRMSIPHYYQYHCSERSYPDNPCLTWHVSHASVLLGLPVKFAHAPMDSSGARYNLPTQTLAINVERFSNKFGSLPDIPDAMGDKLVVRCDGRRLDHRYLMALVACIDDHFVRPWSTWAHTLPPGDAQRTARQRLTKRLTPEAFHSFFEEYRRFMVLNGATD